MTSLSDWTGYWLVSCHHHHQWHHCLTGLATDWSVVIIINDVIVWWLVSCHHHHQWHHCLMIGQLSSSSMTSLSDKSLATRSSDEFSADASNDSLRWLNLTTNTSSDVHYQYTVFTLLFVLILVSLILVLLSHKTDTHFTILQRVRDWVNLGTAVMVHKAVFYSGIVKHTNDWDDILTHTHSQVCNQQSTMTSVLTSNSKWHSNCVWCSCSNVTLNLR